MDELTISNPSSNFTDHADKTDPLKQKTKSLSYPCWSCHLTKVGRGGSPGRLSYRLAVWLEGGRRKDCRVTIVGC